MGVPTTEAELHLPPYDSATDVGAVLNKQFDAALSDKKLTGCGEDLYWGRAQNPSVTDLALAICSAQRLSSVTDQCRAALRQPHWSIMPSKPWDELDNHPARVGRLLLGTSFAKSSSGDAHGAFDDLESAAAIPERIAQTPTLDALRSSLGWQGAVWTMWARCLRQHSLDPQAIRDADRVAAAMPPLPDLRRAIEGEFVYNRVLQAYVVKHGFSEQDMQRDVVSRMLLSRPMVRYFSARTATAWKVVFDNLPEDHTDWKATQAALNKGEAIGAQGSLIEMSANYLYPYTGQVASWWVKQLANRRLAAISLDLLKRRLAGKPLPKNLIEFGDQAIDPYTESPFLYHPTPTGFTLYSTGPDRTDDNARPGGGKGYDIVFNFQ